MTKRSEKALFLLGLAYRAPVKTEQAHQGTRPYLVREDRGAVVRGKKVGLPVTIKELEAAVAMSSDMLFRLWQFTEVAVDLATHVDEIYFTNRTQLAQTVESMYDHYPTAWADWIVNLLEIDVDELKEHLYGSQS